MPVLLPILGASLGYIAAAFGGGAVIGIMYYYGGKVLDDRHQRGLVKAYKKGGPRAFRKYAWKTMGIKSKDEMDGLWEAFGPRTVSRAQDSWDDRQRPRARA
jgi:hypothetical protein